MLSSVYEATINQDTRTFEFTFEVKINRDARSEHTKVRFIDVQTFESGARRADPQSLRDYKEFPLSL